MNTWNGFLLSCLVCVAMTTKAETWYPTPLDSQVSVSFPDIPSKTDTLGQQILSVRINNDLMLAISALVLEEKWPKDSISKAIMLDIYIRETLDGTTLLLQSPAILQQTEAIFYKFKMDEGPNKGLVAENYVFFQSGKIYHFAYWRFQPSELPNQVRMKRYFESVEIKVPVEVKTVPLVDQTAPNDTFKNDKNNFWNYLLLALVAVLSAVVIYFAVEKYRQKTT